PTLYHITQRYTTFIFENFAKKIGPCWACRDFYAFQVSKTRGSANQFFLFLRAPSLPGSKFEKYNKKI
ncbi:MAG: hypothetical protein LBH91_00610, partial [Prevotellaceae bacterium]|nr:hypothetical protein [Prevotellaceae bacterium]